MKRILSIIAFAVVCLLIAGSSLYYMGIRPMRKGAECRAACVKAGFEGGNASVNLDDGLGDECTCYTKLRMPR